MKPTFVQRILSFFKREPSPEFIAGQLRKPSGDFARKVGHQMNEVNEPLYDLILDIMQPQDNDAILEVGFGNGRFFDKLFSKANHLQVSGIDYSKEMVAEAKEYNEEYITSGKLDIQLGSSDNLPFPANTFDKVFCNMVIYFWESPEDHLKEIHRVLKPGGSFYTGIRTRESMLPFPFVEYDFNLYDTEEWKKLLERNGFLFKGAHIKEDPQIDFEGKSIQLESCCIIGEKKFRDR